MNFVMVEAYWKIGRMIVEEEQHGRKRAGYGAQLIQRLSERLGSEFGGGFSVQSLWNMRQFYQCFPILSAVRRELTWTHYKALIRVENEAARAYYATETASQNWTVRALQRQISSLYYERLRLSRDKAPVIQDKLYQPTEEELRKELERERALEQQERLIALTTELKKALLHQLFTQGLRGEPQKQTEIGLVPQSWEVVRLGDVAKLQSGGTPARDKLEYWNGGDIPWVKTGEIDYLVIDTTEEMITPKGLENSAAKVFPKGTLLIAMYGQGVTRGRVGLLGIDAATNQACAAITPHDEMKVSTRFIYHFLEFHYEDLRQMGHGANQRNLNAALIKGFRFSFPKPDEQARIVEALGVLNTKLTLHQSKHAALTALFRTLLHQLMTAQLRVHDIIDVAQNNILKS
ncbi:MAG: restriction endonuclease subunit S [Verrucomicrobia bacterium]|nr:restriction endonuclease subunit S [Verrucomicrobiota bacterium]